MGGWDTAADGQTQLGEGEGGLYINRALAGSGWNLATYIELQWTETFVQHMRNENWNSTVACWTNEFIFTANNWHGQGVAAAYNDDCRQLYSASSKHPCVQSAAVRSSSVTLFANLPPVWHYVCFAVWHGQREGLSYSVIALKSCGPRSYSLSRHAQCKFTNRNCMTIKF